MRSMFRAIAICITLFGLSAMGASAKAAQPHAAQTAAAVPAPANEAHARGDIAGNWQGTIEMGKSIRTVLSITKGDKGWGGKIFLFGDQGAQPFNLSSVTLDGATFKFSVDVIGGGFEGTLSPDGNSVAGTLTGGQKPQPLTLVRATKETAWEIPPPPPPPKLMAADADPSFDVATIKPNDSGASSMQGLTLNGRNFATRNSSLGDLMAFAYEVQMKQIVGAPDWLEKDRYDIAAVPDQEGVPNAQQLRIMIRKLLKSRFNLTFHHDKRDLSAYVLTVGKNGQKLAPTQLKGPLPGIGMRPVPAGLTLNMRNATLTDFVSFLQLIVLDRPVVDRTGIEGRLTTALPLRRMNSQFNGHPPKLPATAATTETAEPAPNLFTAFQEQLGLKLDAEKTAVDVLAIDHVDKPSPN